MDILSTVISIIGALIFVGMIIMVHELGHYSVGRACNMKIVEFAVGFGPKIKSWIKNGIIYSIRWIPLGGFTKFYGEDEDINDKLAFNNQPAGRRALTIAAGPVFNILFAFLLVVIILCSFGDYAPTVGKVWEDSPAQAAGLEAGDIILKMNGVDMDFYTEIEKAQRSAKTGHIPLTVLRNGKEIQFDIADRYFTAEEINSHNDDHKYDVEQGRNMIGFSFGTERVTFGFFEAIALSFKWMFLLVKETILAIIGILAGKGTQNALGIVGIVSVLGQALRSSFELVLRLGVAINVSLAVFNILPLPALDGGRLVFIAIEKIFKKPVPRNVEGMIHLVGFALFFILVIFMTYQDISRIFGG